MKQSDVVTVPASLRSHALVLGLGNLGIAAGLFQIFGPGSTLVLWCSIALCLSIALLAHGAIWPTQRLEITPEGFTSYNQFGRAAQRHGWTDIDGHFAVIWIGANEAIAYKLTADYKARHGKKATSLLSGYDEAIPGLFQLSAPQIALLLNNHKKGLLGAPDVQRAGGEKRA